MSLDFLTAPVGTLISSNIATSPLQRLDLSNCQEEQLPSMQVFEYHVIRTRVLFAVTKVAGRTI
jgi:hypothetical protein